MPLLLGSMFLWGTLGDPGCSTPSTEYNVLVPTFYGHVCKFSCLLPLKKLSIFQNSVGCWLMSLCQSHHCPVVMTEQILFEFSMPFFQPTVLGIRH